MLWCKKGILLVLGFAALLTMGIECTPKMPDPQECDAVNRHAIIEPDYAGIILPPNIAPMNFIIREDGRAYYVCISAERGQDIRIYSRSPVIKIPMKAWKNLLNMNRGTSLQIAIFVQDDQDKWRRFTLIENRIAKEEITSHLVYRIIPPLYQYFDKMHLYQRDLRTFAERTIAFNKSMGYNCINCHSFHDYNPDRMLFHMRAGAVGTSMILLYDGDVFKIDTKTSFNRATSYRSWHPRGDVVAFAFNDVKQLFHALGENRDVFDIVSDLLVYNVATNTISTSPKISTDERMETYPEWSPDGQYLYFCSAPGMDSYDKTQHPYKQMKYDLMRIAYDLDNDSWGDIEPVLQASDLDLSVAHARFSPDGNYILLCLSEYSYFPLYRPESDLYLLDTRRNSLRKADPLNSSAAESYHAWSEDGRWIVFSSKRRDGLCTDLYFSYFDGEGHFGKPFILPQRDPERHRKLFRVYNIPEFVNGLVKVRPQRLIRAAWSSKIPAKLDPGVSKTTSQIEVPMYEPFQ